MYKFLRYEGGVYKSNKIIEEVDDLGGYVLQKNKSSRDITLLIAVPEEDLDIIEEMAKNLKGDLKEEALIGTEICVVSPSISRHHLPHPVCDIAERLRRSGALTNILSIGRGVGRNISQITKKEKSMIEEYDLAVFVFGDFKDCIVTHKKEILDGIRVPKVVIGGPQIEELENADFYVSGVGRKVKRMRRSQEQSKLDEIAETVSKAVNEEREKIKEDPLYIDPLELEKIIRKLDIIKESKRHSPIVLHLDGLRIKLPYDKYVEELEKVVVRERKLSEFSEIKKSNNESNDIIIEIKPNSYVKYNADQVKETDDAKMFSI